MKKESLDDTFLAKWIAGELSPEQTIEFKKSKYYIQYNRINEAAQLLEAPDFNKERVLNNVYKGLDKPKVKRLIPNWAYSAAAVLVIALSIFFFNNSNTIYNTSFGEYEVVMLPDHSKVVLNSKSEIAFHSNDWVNNRELDLRGEAFFDVQKGMSFKVNTNQGTVQVLGTEFNVITRDDYFEVKCHEGRVKVTIIGTNNTVILTEGKAIRLFNNLEEEWAFIEVKPKWIEGESAFKNTPLSEVILALKNQYNLQINSSKTDLNRRFTGSFTHKDINVALETVFGAMKIGYSKTVDNTIVLK